MRLHFLIAALLSFLLAACASAPATAPVAAPAATAPAPGGTLKVHPGLLGQPVPPELRSPEDKAPADKR